MEKIRFMTDSASDISFKDEKELDIVVMPFPVTFGDKTYLSRVEIDNETFYAMLDKEPMIPSTSQITVYEYSESYEKAYQDGYTDLINTTINSEGSGTFNSACLAKEMFFETHPEAKEKFHIHVLDGASYTCGYGYAVLLGARMAAKGASVSEILKEMQRWIDESVVYFVPYTLKYAAKSGRIPQAAAFVGELVGLKAIMRLADHAIVTNDKVRGEKKIIPTLRDKLVKEAAEGSEYLMIYGNNLEDAKALEKLITEAVGYPPVGYSQIGAAVATNAGPRLVGMCFRRKK